MSVFGANLRPDQEFTGNNQILRQRQQNLLPMSRLQVSVPYDEWPLPALQREGRPAVTPHGTAEQRSPHSDGQWSPQSPELSGEPEPLTQKAQREAGFSIEVYGETLVGEKLWDYNV